MTGDRTRTDSEASAVGIREADEPKALAVAIDRLREDAEVMADELNDLVIRVIEDPDGDRARYSGDIGRDLRSLITAHESQAERLREVAVLLDEVSRVYDGMGDGDGEMCPTLVKVRFTLSALTTENGE